MLRSVSLLLIIGLIFSQDLAKKIAECATIEGDLDRLECYDQLAKKNNLFGQQKVPTNVDDVGKWRVSREINPLDDSETVTLILTADSGENYLGKKVYLVVRCRSSEISMYIGWDNYLGREAYVTSRIGTEKAVKNKWSLSTDSQATFDNQPTSTIKAMLGNKKYIAQVTPYNESPVTAIFDITGIDNAVKPLIDVCGEF